jgi:1,5-anhydro-D-fructose reductase (1,5-anhydro-D-mannitol-forming)
MIPAIKAQPDSRVVAIMSSDEERGERYAKKNGILNAYNRIDALLTDPDVDIVYISTTNERHRHETIEAARAGKHVLCEKPLALSLDDAREMVDACAQAGVAMGTNHHLRNAITHRTLRTLIAKGAIGTPLAARVFHAVYLPEHLQGWRLNNPTAGAGVILDITVHDADTLRFILDDEVEEVTALSAQQGMAAGAVEDAVMGVMRFQKGTLAQFHDAFTVKHTATGVEVHGTDASLIAQDVMTQSPIGRIWLRTGRKFEELDLGLHNDLYAHAVRRFNEAARGEGAPWATGEDGLRSLAVGLAVLESTKAGQKVRVRGLGMGNGDF